MSLVGILGAAGSILGAGASIFGSSASSKGQKDTNRTNIRLAQEGREHDVNMWNRQNEYNTPEMQMQRLKEAGLNTNLMYGNGQASTGNADAPKQAHVATTSNELASFANNNAIQMLSAYQDWQVKKAQIKNIEEETQGKNIQNQLQTHYLPYGAYMPMHEQHKRQWESDFMKHNAEGKSLQNQLLQDTYKSQVGLYQSRLGESQQRIEHLRKSTRQKQLQIELDEQLKPYGMSTTDQLWQRMLAPLVKDKFGGFMDFMNDPKQHFKNTFNKKKKK